MWVLSQVNTSALNVGACLYLVPWEFVIFCPLSPFAFVRFVRAVLAYETDEVEGHGFMMITLSEGVQNQSNPNPNASLPSPQAISKVGIDYSTHSCLLGEVGGSWKRLFEKWRDDNATLVGGLCRCCTNTWGEGRWMLETNRCIISTSMRFLNTTEEGAVHKFISIFRCHLQK